MSVFSAYPLHVESTHLSSVFHDVILPLLQFRLPDPLLSRICWGKGLPHAHPSAPIPMSIRSKEGTEPPGSGELPTSGILRRPLI